MRVYTIHLQRHTVSSQYNVIVISESFCWLAFVAAPLWALAHRMWFAALGITSAYALITLAAGIGGVDWKTTVAFVVGAALIVGFCANDWRRISLVSRGWYLAGLAAAIDKEAALRRFIDLHPEKLDPRPPTLTN
ncbi:MAG: DUF2628 domain-containing protein [Pseudomonadota bacterium]|nr:DUF2628 domain-containing protein [Pseudomonadota bacterium]